MTWSTRDSELARMGIYKIEQLSSGRIYIGSAKNVVRRWFRHRHELRNGLHNNPLLQRSWDKYGEGDFYFSLVEPVEDFKDLLVREAYWVCAFGSMGSSGGFNLKEPQSGMHERSLSQESRAKISAAHKASGHRPNRQAIENAAATNKSRQHKPPSSETIRKFVETRRAYGWFTPDGRARVSAASSGRIHSAETRAKIKAYRNANPQVLSEEGRRRISQASLGRKVGAEQRERIADKHFGLLHDSETKEKMRAAKLGKRLSDDQKAQRSARILENKARSTLLLPLFNQAKAAGLIEPSSDGSLSFVGYRATNEAHALRLLRDKPLLFRRVNEALSEVAQ